MKNKKSNYSLIPLCLISSFSLTSCSGMTKEKTKISDYQYIFDIVKDLDEASIYKETEETVLNYGEYCYNSFLLLVPRKTPSTLTSFYFRWQQGMDLDDLGFSFECKLEKDSFDNYVNGLDSFSVTTGDDINKCLKIEDKFDHHVYIIQWLIPNEKWKVFEYIMVDSQNTTVVYVYSIFDCFKHVKDNTKYNIAPNVDKSLVLEGFGNVEDGFSIYMKSGTPTEYYNNPPKLSDLSYDTSFLSYLL